MAGWICVQFSETRRELDLEKLAGGRGLHFRSGLPAELQEVLPRFRAIETARQGGGEFQAGLNSITGRWGDRKIAFFGYRWTTFHPSSPSQVCWGDGNDGRRSHRRSAVAIGLGVGLQPVLIRPERLVDKSLAFVGYEDIDFNQLPEFSRAFSVNSSDPVEAGRLVTPTFARFFIDHVRCTVEVMGPRMLLHQDCLLGPGRVRELMELAGGLSELVTREQSGSR